MTRGFQPVAEYRCARRACARHRGTAARGAALTLALLALAGCGFREETVFKDLPSPDGAWMMRVTYAEPRMPFGRYRVAAYLYRSESQPGEPVVDTTLVNDGVPFTADNIQMRWIDSTEALLCLRATDLPDRATILTVGNPPGAHKSKSC